MRLEPFDWILLISLFIALSIVFYKSLTTKKDIKLFIFGIGLIGIILVWGLWKLDISTIPLWIQAGATLLLLLITGRSTYAAIKTSEANLKLAKTTLQGLEIAEKDRMSKIVLEIAQDIFQPFLKTIHSNWNYLNGGNEIVSFITSKEQNESWLKSCRSPQFDLEKIWYFDAILKDNMNELHLINDEFINCYYKLEKFLNRIYEKQVQTKNDFLEYCTQLKPIDSQFDIDQNIKIIFGLAIANSKRHDYNGYNFFNKFRFQIITELEHLGFKKEMEEYWLLKDEFRTLCSRSEKLVQKIFLGWREKYCLTEKQLLGDEVFRVPSERRHLNLK